MASWKNASMHVTAKVDYAARAMVELAQRGGSARADELAEAQGIPIGFLRGILGDLRRTGLVSSHSGPSGGFRLQRPAEQITIAQIIRAVEGPLAQVRGFPPNQVDYTGSAEALQDVWIAVRANLRAVLDHTTIAQVANGKLPSIVKKLAADPAAWDVIPR